MKTNPLKPGALTENSTSLGTVTRKLVRELAVDLAVIAGHTVKDVSKSDWEKAKRELTDGPAADPKAAILESTPESERWDPVPGLAGRKTPVVPGADVNDEGRSDNERLVEEGIEAAEHDQMRQASLRPQNYIQVYFYV
ncbi:MAG: hypothetical protein WAO02_03285 [Verrucomicrobiia bacterium]